MTGVPGAMSGTPEYKRRTMNRGVDMRTLSTDNIESVEIIRGIPSSEYGNLTSGVVSIKRIRKHTPFGARLKVDGYSKLLSVGKGFLVGNGDHVLNIDAGYLDSRTDPRDNYENYKRANASVRANLQWSGASFTARWNVGADYTGSFDNAKTDPDLSLLKVDQYRATYNRFSLSSEFSAEFHRLTWLSGVDLNASASYTEDILTRRKQAAPQRASVAPTTMEPQTICYTFYNSPSAYNLRNVTLGSIAGQILKSKLQADLREARGWTYGVKSHVDISAGMNGGKEATAILPVYIRVQPEHADETFNIVAETVESLMDPRNITADELDKVKGYLAKSYEAEQNDNAYWLTVMRMYDRFGEDMNSGYLQLLESVTPEDVSAFAKSHLLDANRLQLSLGARR